MAEPSSAVNVRVKAIVLWLTRVVRRFVTRGLFERHKVLFVLQLALKMDTIHHALTREGLNVLLRGGIGVSLSAAAKTLQWLPDDAWKSLVALTTAVPALCS